MRVLVTYGSTRGGTEEIARWVSEELRTAGLAVDLAPASAVRDVGAFDVVIVGGALYMGAWHRDATRFVRRHVEALRQRHVWLFSSGPLDDSADGGGVGPTDEVASLLAHVGGHGHVTFGGRLRRDARGFIASSMAKQHAGDYRDLDQVEAWSRGVARHLAGQPGQPTRPASSFAPLPSHRDIAWLCALVAIGAVAGGGALALRPDGSLLGLQLAELRHAPFESYLVPGLLLFLVVGLGHAWAALALVRGRAFAPLLAAACGVALLSWTITECVMLRSFDLLEAACVVVGSAIVVRSSRAIRGMFPSAPTPTGASDGTRA